MRTVPWETGSTKFLSEVEANLEESRLLIRILKLPGYGCHCGSLELLVSGWFDEASSRARAVLPHISLDCIMYLPW